MITHPGPGTIEADRIEAAFVGLSDNQRWLVWQVHVIDRPVDEVASDLGVEARTVATLTDRAVAHLRLGYADLDGPPDA